MKLTDYVAETVKKEKVLQNSATVSKGNIDLLNISNC